MSQNQSIRLLLVEDDSHQVEEVKATFAGLEGVNLKLSHVKTLSKALAALKKKQIDLVLLDLGLPDSQGVTTFISLHEAFPKTPVLVLAGPDDEALAVQAVEEGANDYLLKRNLQPTALTRTIKYAMARARSVELGAALRQKAQQERELSSIERLSKAPGTAVTAGIYSGAALRESAPESFAQILTEYRAVLEASLDLNVFKTGSNTGHSEELRRLAEDLGILRASPRDVIELHSIALKHLVKNVPWQKAQAYLQEGRLSVLEIMGYLAGFYRSHYSRSRKELDQ